MRKVIITITYLAIFLGFTSFGPKATFIKSTYYFGVNLQQSTTSKPCHYALIRIFEDGNKQTDIITEDTWMRQIGGLQESKANPEKINMWAKYQVDYYMVYDLWKLRWPTHPFKMGAAAEGGWANSESVNGHTRYPSSGQRKILAEFGMKQFSNFIYGEDMFKLLYSMNDASWVANYQSQ